MLDYKKASDKELLRLVVREKVNESVVDDLFKEFKTIDRLIATADETELTKIKNIGSIRASQIKAIYELAYRLYKKEYRSELTITSPEDVARIVTPEMRFLKKEHFRILLLNTKNQVINIHTVSVGTLNSSLVHPREVFNIAIKYSSASIICVHNHPSGNPQPSREDISITNRLIESGDILGIRILDHVVVAYGTDKYVSLKEMGYMD